MLTHSGLTDTRYYHPVASPHLIKSLTNVFVHGEMVSCIKSVAGLLDTHSVSYTSIANNPTYLFNVVVVVGKVRFILDAVSKYC